MVVDFSVPTAGGECANELQRAEAHCLMASRCVLAHPCRARRALNATGGERRAPCAAAAAAAAADETTKCKFEIWRRTTTSGER